MRQFNNSDSLQTFVSAKYDKISQWFIRLGILIASIRNNPLSGTSAHEVPTARPRKLRKQWAKNTDMAKQSYPAITLRFNLPIVVTSAYAHQSVQTMRTPEWLAKKTQKSNTSHQELQLFRITPGPGLFITLKKHFLFYRITATLFINF